MDNGGDTIKFGWSTDTEPRCVPNVTARLQQQWTVLVADQLSQIQNPNQLIGVTRSMERGVIVNMGNQVQVWKRILDLLGVNLSSTINPDTAQAFGWKLGAKKNQQQNLQKQALPIPHIPPHTCAVLLSVPPLCPRAVLDQIVSVWMQEFGFAHVGLCTGPLLSSRTLVQDNKYQTACMVDLGWSATHIVPTIAGRLVPQPNDASPNNSVVRRLALGARHLIKIWQYHCSYRQWNLMDQEFILRECLEQTGYMSMDYKGDMQEARKWPLGLRPYDRDVLLPDYQNTFEMSFQIPPPLQQRLKNERDGKDNAEEEEDDDDSSDEDVREEDMNEEDIEEDEGDDNDDEGKETKNKISDQDEEDDDDEDEDALRERLLKERAAEEKRKQLLKEEQQVLRISVERFAIPEALFRPSDVGLPMDWAGLASVIHHSIQACPDYLHAAMYRSVYLVGGLSLLKNLKESLEIKLRALVPCEYNIVVTAVPNAIYHCWNAMKALAREDSHDKWSSSRDEWEAMSRRGVWRSHTVHQGGIHLI